MDTHEATATTYVPLEGGLLLVTQDVAGGIQEYDSAIAAQVAVSELPRIAADLYAEVVVMSKVPDRASARPDRCVSFACSPRKHENAKVILVAV